MAIISILASMILPSLGKAKEKAITIHCVNNLRQLGLAMQMYADDYNERLPYTYPKATYANGLPWNSTNPHPWLVVLADYYKNTNVVRCSAFSRVYNQSGYNYFINTRAAYVTAGKVPANVRLKLIDSPSFFILSGDCNWAFNQQDADPNNDDVDTLFQKPSPVHNNRVNILFADWHIKTYKKFMGDEMSFSYYGAGTAYQ